MSRSLFPSSRLDMRDWWDVLDTPRRISDQHFGVGLLEDDFLAPSSSHGCYIRPRRQPVVRKRGTGTSEVNYDNKKFLISLDVSQFQPSEISVKTVDDTVVIHAKHEERQDEHGFIAREFNRRYIIPKDVEATAVTSTLTADGFLNIEAPRKSLETPKNNERVVPITVKSKEDRESTQVKVESEIFK